MQDYQKRLALSLLAYAVQKNINVEQLCERSGVDIKTLRSETSTDFSTQQFSALWLVATELSRDPFFGLHFGESLQLTALGVVGELLRHSRTIGEALTHAAGFGHLVTDMMTMEMERAEQSFTLRFIPDHDRQIAYPELFRQVMDFFMAFALHEVDGLILRKMNPSVVKMAHGQTKLYEYQRVLRCPIIQRSDTYSMEFASDYWDEPILTADYELQRVLLRKVSTLNDAFANTQVLSERINRYLLANAYMGVPTLDAIAANLNVSSRSLQRKLQEEGVTYQQLTDSMRKSLALHYLKSGNYPVKEVSYILGYNELSAFNRAFRRWTGTTPASYQKKYS
ncbi:AraC family transcriptional regulator ligand-binding domain-containing protein [Spirosoma sp. SC4-14]|uniref:AraC family transcriptional regulator n=1 Tax=Spirosoma sp. SC4-14 TaxID=3128900 RepID=UPI0030D519AE